MALPLGRKELTATSVATFFRSVPPTEWRLGIADIGNIFQQSPTNGAHRYRTAKLSRFAVHKIIRSMLRFHLRLSQGRCDWLPLFFASQ
jgi:hypothetical protein